MCAVAGARLVRTSDPFGPVRTGSRCFGKSTAERNCERCRNTGRVAPLHCRSLHSRFTPATSTARVRVSAAPSGNFTLLNYDIPATCYFTLFSLSLDANRLDASNGLDDAACSRDVEEVVAAGLETCSATVCITHVRTAARSHTHRDQLSNASAAHFVREDEDPCKMTYSRMALIERDLSATTQMQMHSQMGFSCSNRRAARQRQASGAAHTQHGGARLARACVTETPQAESRATGGARLLAQTTAAQLRMLT